METDAQQDSSAHLAALKQQMLTARDAGFDSLWVPQHFLTGPTMRQFAAVLMLGLLAGLAPGMRRGTAVLPMLNPQAEVLAGIKRFGRIAATI